MTVPEQLEEMGYNLEEMDIGYFVNPSYDSAFVGISTEGQAIYDYHLMVKHLVETESMSEEEAEDFISYNTIRALPYFDKSPIIMLDSKYNLETTEQ